MLSLVDVRCALCESGEREVVVETPNLAVFDFRLFKRSPEWFVRFFHFQNPFLLAIFPVFDFVRARFAFQTSSQKVMARRRGIAGGSHAD